MITDDRRISFTRRPDESGKKTYMPFISYDYASTEEQAKALFEKQVEGRLIFKRATRDQIGWLIDAEPAPKTKFDFGEALRALKAGKRIRRAGWNGKDMWLSLTKGSQVAAHNFWSPHNRDHALACGGMATVLPAITMKTATGEILMGWLASQTDMLSEDWEILE